MAFMPGWLIEKGWARFGSQVRGLFGSFFGCAFVWTLCWRLGLVLRTGFLGVISSKPAGKVCEHIPMSKRAKSLRPRPGHPSFSPPALLIPVTEHKLEASGPHIR